MPKINNLEDKERPLSVEEKMHKAYVSASAKLQIDEQIKKLTKEKEKRVTETFLIATPFLKTDGKHKVLILRDMLGSNPIEVGLQERKETFMLKSDWEKTLKKGISKEDYELYTETVTTVSLRPGALETMLIKGILSPPVLKDLGETTKGTPSRIIKPSKI